jgi:CHASE1-domain containing sensor protein
MIKYSIHKNTRIAFLVLFTALVLTAIAGYFSWSSTASQATKEFSLNCKEIETKITTRLHNHAQLLRSGASFFEVSKTINREDWKNYYENSKIDNYLPGILGLGYSRIIPKNQLENHIQSIKNEGFLEYIIHPTDDRDYYTSIIYLEPFNFRNQRAFGYDMFTETVRRKAMEQARDYDMPSLSGKVLLGQETEQDLQAGTLMYVPVYREQMPTNTVEERRAAIEGWVYSPYRMDDLMKGVLGFWELDDANRINLQIFDDIISDKSLLYDNQKTNLIQNNELTNRKIIISINFT